MIDLARTLARCGLFRGFDETRLAEVARAAEEIPLAAGAVLLREGEPGDAMYVVLAGAVQVYTRDREGREVVLRRLEVGDHLGEQSLLPGTTGRRTASVRATEPVRLACIPKADFQAALDEDDALRERLLALRDDQVRHGLQTLSPLARGLGLERIAARPRPLADGEVLFREGDDADALYFVSAGRLAVSREEGGRSTLIRVVERGGCVGELALRRRDRRSATVTARGPAEVLAVPRAAFDEVYGRSEDVRQYLATLERVYELPRRDLVTQHAGTFAGHDCITTLYHLTDGRAFAAYRVVGQDLYALERLGGDAAETLAWRDDTTGRSRELRLAADATLVGLTARGAWPDAHTLHVFVLDGERVGTAQRWEFARSGRLDAAVPVVADVVCHCVNLTAATLRAAIEQGAATFDRLQKATGCGTVCGGCVPAVAEMLGAEEWVLADVVSECDEAPGVRSFELIPRSADYPEATPGQHVVVEGRVNGMRLRRPYTLSSAGRHAGRLRVTIKREAEGAFSRWLFDERPKDVPLRITRPRGDYVIDLAGGPVACLAAGIGITPALAAARTLAGDGHGRRLLIHYSGRSRERMPCLRELEEASARGPVVELVVRETAREGRLDAAAVAALVGRIPGATWHVCGPAPYMDQATRSLRVAGVAAERIRVEAFTPVGVTPAATAEERAAVTKYLLVEPKPVPPRPVVRALRRTGAAVVAIANSPLTDWQVGGAQLNPLRLPERRLGRALGLDPTVPHEHLAVLSALSWGPFDYQVRGFERLHARGTTNRERARRSRSEGTRLPPDTPDGDTFGYVLPTAPFPRFPAGCVVDTGWTRPSPGRLLPVYVTRSRAAVDHMLRRGEDTDRGPIPHYYLQQIVGRTDVASCPGRKAAGLVSGQLHDNATWTEDRALAAELFAFSRIDGFGPGMEGAVASMCSTIDDLLARNPHAVVDLNVLVSKMAYTIIVRAIFGDVDLAEMHALGRTMSESFRKLMEYLWEFVMGRQSVPADYFERQRGARGTVRRVIELLRELDRQGRLTPAQRASAPIRAILDAAGEPDGGHGRLYALFLPIILGGHETTGHTVSWALYEMTRRPELEAALVAEIQAFRVAQAGRPLTTADYDERPLTWALLAETLRRHPPTAAMARMTVRAGAVPPDAETGIGAFRYPAGAMVVFSFLGMHLDPRRWSGPYEFQPERWLDGARDGMSAAEKGHVVRANIRAREQALDWLPFSDGAAHCPGQHFNSHEFLVVLDGLLSRYRFELVDPAHEVQHTETMIVGPEPGRMAVRIHRRPRA